MSKFTTQLRWIVEQESKDTVKPSSQRYPDKVYTKLGLSEYPIFDEDYRSALNDKIIDHFYFREIGFETAAQFQWYMRRTMNEIMPKYNMLYAALEDITPEELFYTDYNKKDEEWDRSIDDTGDITKDTGFNEDVGKSLKKTGTDTRSYDGTITDTEDSRTLLENSGTITSANTGTIRDNGSTTSQTVEDSTVDVTEHNRNVFQDTPMSLLDNSEYPTVQGLDYATNVTYADNNSTTETDSTIDVDTTSQNTRTLGDTNTKTLNDDHETTVDKENIREFDNTDTLTHNTTDTETLDRETSENVLTQTDMNRHDKDCLIISIRRNLEIMDSFFVISRKHGIVIRRKAENRNSIPG